MATAPPIPMTETHFLFIIFTFNSDYCVFINKEYESNDKYYVL